MSLDKNSIYFSPEIDKVFSDILKMDKSINFVEFIKIYRKIKSLNSISDLEFSKITIFLNTKFYDLLNEYATSKNNINRALINKYKKIKISLEIKLNRIRIIDLIESNNSKGVEEENNKRVIYEKIIGNDKKTYYIEVIQENGNYKIGYDIRKYKFVLFYKNNVLSTSELEIYFSDEIKNDGALVFSKGINGCYIFNNSIIDFDLENSVIFKNNYGYLIINKKTSQIIIIEKNGRYNIKDIYPNNILEVNNGYMLCFIPPTHEFGGKLSLYSLYENKEIIGDLDFRNYKFTKNYFSGVSIDGKTKYRVNFKK